MPHQTLKLPTLHGQVPHDAAVAVELLRRAHEHVSAGLTALEDRMEHATTSPPSEQQVQAISRALSTGGVAPVTITDAVGTLPPSPNDPTLYLNGAALPAFAPVEDAHLAVFDIEDNNATIDAHGFLPKLSGNPAHMLNGEGAWVLPPTGSPIFSYDFDAATTAPPAAQEIRFNAGHPYTAVTTVWISRYTRGGTDVHAGLAAQPAGATIYVQQRADATRFAKVRTTAEGTEIGDYFAFPVVWVANGAAIADGEEVALQFAGGGTSALAPHASTHYDGAIDEVDITALAGYPPALRTGEALFLSADRTWAAAGSGGAHATTHETGGSDPIDALSAAVLTSGTLPDARFPATLPAVSGANLTNLDANDLATGTVPDARLSGNVLKHTGGYPGGTTTYLRADGTFAAPPGGGGGTPGGLTTQVQFNDGGAFGGDSGLTFDKTTDLLTTGSLQVLAPGYHAIGPARNPNIALWMNGTHSTPDGVGGYGATGFYQNQTIAPVVGQAAYGIASYITVTKAASGTHPNVAGLLILPPVIAGGAAAVTNAASLNITGAPTGGVNNYALYVSAGITRLADRLLLSGTAVSINPETLDGADNASITLHGGGYQAAGSPRDRGAIVRVYGNEGAAAGVAQIIAGNVAGSAIQLYRGDGIVAQTIDGATGLATFYYDIRLSKAAGSNYISTPNSTSFLTLCGSYTADRATGAWLLVGGNTSAYPGSVRIEMGNVAGSYFGIVRADANWALYMDNTGATTFYNNVSMSGGTVNVTGVLYVGSSSGYISMLNPGGNTIYMNVLGQLFANTAAGADSGHILLSGCSGADGNRAAYFWVCGNQHASYPGSINALLSNHASAYFRIFNSNASRVWFYLRGSDGNFNFDTTNFVMGQFNSTSANGGYVTFLTSSAATGWIGTAATLISTTYVNACLCVRSASKLVLKSDIAEIVAPDIYNNTYGVAANVVIDNSGLLRRSSSSRRYKRAIAPLADWRPLLALQPVSFEHISEAGVRRVGLLAEDVAAVDPRLAVCGADGRPEEVCYAHLTAPLIAAIQDLHARLDRLERSAHAAAQ
jgi:hypothetical protein